MSTTANTIITSALQLLGVIDPEDTPSPAMLTTGFRRLNLMMGSWSLQSFTIPTVAREVFPLVSGQGGPSNPYTIGPGGNFNTTRPASIEGAGLLMPGSPIATEIPRAIYTDDAYEALAQKELPNSQFTGVYYNATFAGGLGTVNLWPVPNTTLYSLVLYRLSQLGLFVTPTASYDLPEGADEAVEYNLALRLAGPYMVTVDPLIHEIAVKSLAVYKRSNIQMSDLPMDPMFLMGRNRPSYDIEQGNG